jgi:hypothetical protein
MARIPFPPTAITVRQAGAKVIEAAITVVLTEGWDYIEWYRGAVDSPADAVLVATSKLTSHHDQNLVYGTTYYYWARVVDRQGERSAFSPSSGHSITVAAIVPEDVATTWPGARVTQSTPPTITNDTQAYLSFDTEDYDTAGLHESVTNPSRLTAPKTGQYALFGQTVWASNTVGFRHLSMEINGTTTIVAQRDQALTSGPLGNQQAISTVYRLTAGDYARLGVRQNSGGDLGLATAAIFSMHWIGP